MNQPPQEREKLLGGLRAIRWLTRQPGWLSALILATVAFLMAVSAAETGLRLAGHQPWRYEANREPGMHIPDEILGWRNQPQRFVYPAYTNANDSIVVTFLSDGRRLSGHASPGSPKIGVFGGSYTMGWGVSDDESYASQLQAMLSSVDFRNYGTAGYGTLQSLLRFQEVATQEPLAAAIYGLLDHHEERNVATLAWLEAIARAGAAPHVPFATVNEEGWEYHPPTTFRLWPLRTSLAIVDRLQHAVNASFIGHRLTEARAVTEKLLVEFDETCNAKGIPCVVALLQDNEDVSDHYRKFLSEYPLEFVDCAFELTGELAVPGEGRHPGATLHGQFARCIGGFLKRSPRFSHLF